MKNSTKILVIYSVATTVWLIVMLVMIVLSVSA